MNPANVTVGLSALAGLASFLSPCVLALVPAYVSYLGGRTISSKGEVVENRWATFAHGVAFVAGFSIVFVALGAAASLIGAVLYDLRNILAKVGGVIVIIFGLHTLGILNIPLLDIDTRRQSSPDASGGLLSSALMGVFFSAGWAPCVGPVLGAVLTLAINGANVGQGVVLLSAYSVGLAVPFLLAALGIGRVTYLMREHRSLVRALSLATGFLLVIVGILLFTGTLERLANLGFFVDFGI